MARRWVARAPPAARSGGCAPRAVEEEGEDSATAQSCTDGARSLARAAARSSGACGARQAAQGGEWRAAVLRPFRSAAA